MAYKAKETVDIHINLYNTDEGDHIYHVVRGGHPDTYFLFEEDAYEQQPYQSGITSMTKAALELKFNIKLPDNF